MLRLVARPSGGQEITDEEGKGSGALVACNVWVRREPSLPRIESRLEHLLPVLFREIDQLRFDPAEVFAADALDICPVPLPFAAA